MTFKLARWDERLACWVDGKRAYSSEAEARAAAKTAGRYRISSVDEYGRWDSEPFEVVGAAAGGQRTRHPSTALRPMSGKPH